MPEPLSPSTVDELKDTVAAAVAERRPLEIVGAGTKRGYGRPLDGTVPVSVAALSGITLYEPAELVMSAAAGTPLAEIEARLTETRQRLAFEPPDYGALLGGAPGRGTIGGVFACNLAGPRRIRDGAARDHFLGVEAVTGRGDLIKSGGRVVKNVSGYDLCKLFAGSFGTLVAMTRVTFKVMPAPEDTRTLLVAGLDEPAALGVARGALGEPYEVSGSAYLPRGAAARSAVGAVAGAGGPLAAIRLEGPEPSVRYRSDALKRRYAGTGGEMAELDGRDSATLWREVRDVALLPGGDGGALWRISVAPAAGGALVADLRGRLPAAEALFDWAGGLVWLLQSGGPEDGGGAALVREAVARHGGGHATLLRAPTEVRAAVPVFQPQTPALARLTERVKDSFDPQRVLNPGRMYAGV